MSIIQYSLPGVLQLRVVNNIHNLGWDEWKALSRNTDSANIVTNMISVRKDCTYLAIMINSRFIIVKLIFLECLCSTMNHWESNTVGVTCICEGEKWKCQALYSCVLKRECSIFPQWIINIPVESTVVSNISVGFYASPDYELKILHWWNSIPK